MDEKQIRIGNKVKRNGLVVVADFMTAADCHQHPEQYEPIPLSGEVLNMVGFKEDGHSLHCEFFNYGATAIVYCKLSDDVGLIKKGEYRFVFNHQLHIRHAILLKYLHELQNAYFVLIGDELEVNP